MNAEPTADEYALKSILEGIRLAITEVESCSIDSIDYRSMDEAHVQINFAGLTVRVEGLCHQQAERIRDLTPVREKPF